MTTASSPSTIPATWRAVRAWAICPGGQFIIPRDIIKAVANHFVDMAPETIREKTFCCGGGGGLLTDDLMELRVKGALPRMEALKSVVDEHGVNFMATICAICKAQFTKVLPYYGFDMRMVGGVHQLVSKAIRLGENSTFALMAHKSQQCRQLKQIKKAITFRRYKDGDNKVGAWQEKIFDADHSHKCPTYIQTTPPCQGSCPAGRGYPRLPEHRARHRKTAGRDALAGIRVPPADRSQPVSRR